ncbi:MAG: BatD family protein [Proteobacteria bacterium]|nr:BatD family protein [Pseudomonadota bacterium]MBU1710283.1 BatD family protein [Pseudomonadota bacterium]
MNQLRNIFIIAWILAVIFLPVLASGQELAARAAVEKQEVFVGESFLFQVQVEGDEAPAQPDLSSLDAAFHVQQKGGQTNSGKSITIINGKVTQVSKSGYVFSYSLTPKRAGTHTIPPITVVAGNKNLVTDPVTIIARKPLETDEFKLRITLSKDQCYVGEPITLTVTWYVSKDVRDIEFNMPFLDDDRFSFEDFEDPAQMHDAVRIPLGSGEVIGDRGKAVLDGKEYMTLEFRKTMTPKPVGKITLPQATVSSKILTGYNRNQSRDPFSMFDDDFFGRGRRGVYTTVVTPSNQPELLVQALPANGRPADFSGLIGKFSLTANAEPLDVSIGDPITLTVQVAGKHIKNVELPALESLPGFREHFKIPQEIAPGETAPMVKTFTQTIRAKQTTVNEIPPVSLNFFNTDTGRYETAQSPPIPITVKATKVVTATDAEGRVLSVAQKELQTVKEGIAHNYAGPDVLEMQQPVSERKPTPFWLVVLLLPPACFMLLYLGLFFIQRRAKNPAARNTRKAYSLFLQSMKGVSGNTESEQAYETMATALQTYLGYKMGIKPGAITFDDIETPLAEKGASPQNIAALMDLFTTFEARRYAGGSASPQNINDLKNRGIALVGQLEKDLGS